MLKKTEVIRRKKRLLFESEENIKNKESHKELKSKNINNNPGDKIVNIEKSKNKIMMTIIN